MCGSLHASRGSLRWFNTSKGSRGTSTVLRLTSKVNDAKGWPCPSDIGSLGHYRRIGRYHQKVMSRVSEGHTGQMQKLVLESLLLVLISLKTVNIALRCDTLTVNYIILTPFQSSSHLKCAHDLAKVRSGLCEGQTC